MARQGDPLAHYRVLQQLRDHGSLTPEGPNASVSNPRWFRSDGTLRQVRQAEHHRIINDVIGSSSAAQPSQQPIAILLAGPPGSGKSSARRSLFDAGDEQITGGLNASNFVVIDADSIKEKLLDIAEHDGSLQSFLMPPEARALQAQGEVFSKLDFASLVHEESSMIADAARETAIERRLNLILDQVCSNPRKTAALVDKLANQGYTVRIVEIHAEKEFSEQSVFLRYLRDQERAEGRYVPTEVIDSVYTPDGTSRPRQSIQSLLEAKPCRLDAYRRFDAKTVGQPPELTQRGHNIDGQIQPESVTDKPQHATEPEAPPSKHILLASFPKRPGRAHPSRPATPPQVKPGQRTSPRPERHRGR